MHTITAKPDKFESTVETIAASIFFCIPIVCLLGIVMAKDHPVPVNVQGCYKSGDQTLQVQSTRIIVNGKSTPEVDVKYQVTNIGPQIETVNGSWLELDQAKPPQKQVGRNMIIRVEDNALFAFTSNGDAIPFVRVMPPAKCGDVVDRPSPT